MKGEKMCAIKIWVLEDEEMVRDLLLDALPFLAEQQERKVEIEGFESPAEISAQKLKERPPNIIFSDIEMPKEVPSGLEFIADVRTLLEGNIKIIAMSGKPDDFKQASLDAGANFFMAKPFEIAVLADIFKQVVSGLEE